MAASTEVIKKQSQEVDAEEAAAIETQIKVALADGKEAMWRLAEALYAFHEGRGYLKLGHETLEEWLAQAEIGMKRAWFFNLVDSWRKVVIERKVDPERLRGLEPSKVVQVLPALQKGKDADGKKFTVDDVLADVEVLGFRDLREKYTPKKVQAPVQTDDNPAKTDKGDSGQDAPAEPPEAEDDPPTEGGDASTSSEEPGEAAGSEPEPELVTAGREIEVEAFAEQLGLERIDPEESWSLANLRLPTAVADEAAAPTTTSPSADALAECEGLPWKDLEESAATGAAYPRVAKETLEQFIAWRQKHLL